MMLVFFCNCIQQRQERRERRALSDAMEDSTGKLWTGDTSNICDRSEKGYRIGKALYTYLAPMPAGEWVGSSVIVGSHYPRNLVLTALY